MVCRKGEAGSRAAVLCGSARADDVSAEGGTGIAERKARDLCL